MSPGVLLDRIWGLALVLLSCETSSELVPLSEPQFRYQFRLKWRQQYLPYCVAGDMKGGCEGHALTQGVALRHRRMDAIGVWAGWRAHPSPHTFLPFRSAPSP